MKSSKKILLNGVVGFFSQMFILILGFVVPRIVLSHYGADLHGLTSTITQIVGYVALLESGIGLSAKNALYKPIANDNRNDISQILSATRKYYRKISYFYLALIVVLSFTLPLIINTTIDYWTIFGITIFEGLTSVVSFYFIDTYTCFLSCIGKSYVINTFDLLGKFISYGCKIALALLNINFVFIQLSFFVASLIRMLIYTIYMKKNYSWINYNYPIENYKLPYRGSYLITEITWTVFSSTDSVLISIFVSTVDASIYSIYNMVFSSLSTIINSIYSAISYKLGETFSSDLEKYKTLHDLYTSFIMAITTTFMCTAYYLIIPFVSLYTKGITDVNYINYYFPLLFCIIQLLSWSRYVSSNLVCLAGFAKQVSIISIIEAVINLTSSIIFIHYFGSVGALFGTVVSLPLKVIYCFIISEKRILKRKPFKELAILVTNYSIFAIAVIVYHYITFQIDNYWWFILYGLIFVLIFSLIVAIANLLVNHDLIHIFKAIRKKK